ncbi:hypothetical protein [Streptomyces sp. NPDC059455]|uniref:hypothetical protein n=1 Tax=Streptomyces sp. NPDC059455 TaxID=3346837 RepID=UPI0036AE41EF
MRPADRVRVLRVAGRTTREFGYEPLFGKLEPAAFRHLVQPLDHGTAVAAGGARR